MEQSNETIKEKEGKHNDPHPNIYIYIYIDRHCSSMNCLIHKHVITLFCFGQSKIKKNKVITCLWIRLYILIQLIQENCMRTMMYLKRS